MSVLIRGMEMPTLCRTYKVRFSESGDGKIIVGIANEDSTAYRPIGEVISVPPHGRLIDAAELMEQVERDTPLSAVYEKTMRRYLNNAPTVIPAEEAQNG